MSKVIGPLLSLDAHGQVGKGLIFQKSLKGFKVDRFHKPKKQLSSILQSDQRIYYKFITGLWWKLTPAQRIAYNNRGNGESGFNVYLREQMPILKTHKFSFCPYFNTVNHYLYKTINDYRSSDFSGSFTTFIKPELLANTKCLISSGRESDTNYYWWIFIDGSGYISIQNKSGGTVTTLLSTTALTMGQWYHIAVTSNGSRYLLYINGNPDVLRVIGGSNNGNWLGDVINRNNITLGVLKRSTYYGYYKGYMSNACLYNIELTQAQIVAKYQGGFVSDGIVGQWPLSANGGSIAYDVSGFDNHMTIVNYTLNNFWNNYASQKLYNLRRGFNYDHTTNIYIPAKLNKKLDAANNSLIFKPTYF